MNRLNPTHNQFAPLNVSMKKNNLAFASAGSKTNHKDMKTQIKSSFCVFVPLWLKQIRVPAVAGVPASHLQSAVSER
jgi:hypothetical protein